MKNLKKLFVICVFLQGIFGKNSVAQMPTQDKNIFIEDILLRYQKLSQEQFYKRHVENILLSAIKQKKYTERFFYFLENYGYKNIQIIFKYMVNNSLPSISVPTENGEVLLTDLEFAICFNCEIFLKHLIKFGDAVVQQKHLNLAKQLHYKKIIKFLDEILNN